MTAHKNKVVAYITYEDRLLVFRQPHSPKAGIQVPAGTVEEGEDPDAAVLREAREETGLDNLHVIGFLGEQARDLADCGRHEIHNRRFYHLHCIGDPPVRWRHHELYGLWRRHRADRIRAFLGAPAEWSTGTGCGSRGDAWRLAGGDDTCPGHQ